jgi:formylglycine-generating enzyme required for sulfatase activity
MKKPNLLTFFSVLYFASLLYSTPMRANGIIVNNISLTGRNTSAGVNNSANFVMVQFDLTWENSWRISSNSSNWDAAWIFIKFKIGKTDPTLSGVNSSGNIITVNSTSNLRVGMPIRVTGGTGLFSSTTIINSIVNETQFIASETPLTPLSNAVISCSRIWEHAKINNTGNYAPSGANVQVGLVDETLSFNNVSNPAVGAFIYRSANGSGTFSPSGIKVRWNYGSQNINDDFQVTIKVIATEMVWVPEGSFYVGSGGTEGSSFTDGSWISGATIPFQINSSGSLSINNTSGNLWGTSTSGLGTIGGSGTLGSAFPKGYAGFYLMKHEISQGSYRDFLNSLNRLEQINRVNTSISIGTTSVSNRFVMSGTSTLTNRNGIRCDANIDPNEPINFYCDFNGNGIGNESADGEWIACNFITWADDAAWTDWAALRPFTELEFEKACRGTNAAVPNEYAWGSSVYTAANNITNGGNNNEITNTLNANVILTNQPNVQGPLRSGIFALSSSSRDQSGASWYGILELSGNLWERIISVGSSEGRSFTGLHGDGILSQGSHNVSNWPSSNSAVGTGIKGGSFSATASRGYTSGRTSASFATTSRVNEYGFRAARSSPSSSIE